MSTNRSPQTPWLVFTDLSYFWINIVKKYLFCLNLIHPLITYFNYSCNPVTFSVPIKIGKSVLALILLKVSYIFFFLLFRAAAYLIIRVL